MRKGKQLAALVLAAVMILTLCAFEQPSTTKEMYKALHGTWQGSFHVVVAEGYYTEDLATINFINDGEDSELYLTVQTAEGNYVRLNSWEVEDETLSFSYNEDPWTCQVELSFTEDGNLAGTFSQYGKNYSTTFAKVSSQPTDLGTMPRYVFGGMSSSQWLDQLRAYPDYLENGTTIPFTYELGKKSNMAPFIQDYQVDALMQEASGDIEKMQVLLDVVCDNVLHDGASGMPLQQDALSVYRYSQEKGGVECRGLSIILAELCRDYGIPARSVKCAPAMADAEYCHVVVHAYSQDLGKWVMMDPTYHLMLRGTDGTYLSIPEVRQALINGDEMVANDQAGRNGRPFYMDYYRGYMAQNMFHFSTPLNASFGTDTTDTAIGGPVYALVPSGYSSTYAYYRNERPTYDARAFWEAPVLAEKEAA